MRTGFIILLYFIFQCTLHAQQIDSRILKDKNFLVYTKNGEGFVHDNIPSSTAAFQKLGRELNFSVDTTENPNIFSEEKLKNYDAIIFANTNNDVFDTEAQKVAFMRYIQAGGGYIGIHSATGTERNWKWFKLMMGATFLRHPPLQPYTVHVLDPVHPTTKNLQQKWDTIDESYYFKEINPSIKVLLYSDLSQVKESGDGKHTKPDVFGNRYPVAWCHMFDGGKIWYTSLGHSKEDYENPVYLAHIIEGLKWVADKGKLDYKKSYAISSTEINENEIF
jgi:type 1 glutamine amidotransferase